MGKDESEKESEKEKEDQENTINKDVTISDEVLQEQIDNKNETVQESNDVSFKEESANYEYKEVDTSNTDHDNTAYQEDNEISGDENSSDHFSDFNMSGIVNRHIPDLLTQKSNVSMRSVDGSCFFKDEDLEIADLDSTLTKEDVKQAITDIQEQGGKVNKDKFINTMMDFFPLYNIEENKEKLSKLFDRLDKHNEELISFRQFMLVAIAFSSVPLQDKLTRIFKLIDENDDEELTYEEFEEIVKDILVLKEERKISQTNIEERFSRNTFRDMGMNSEGKVNLSSFVEACTRQRFIIINYVENFRDGFLVNKIR